MGETRVDLVHLLEDLQDAYSGPLDETILTEIVANSLDSGARTIAVLTDAQQTTLTVVDDGAGMKRRELARYHDLATSTKTRGEGIGFAGVGIKLGLLASVEVMTETRRGPSHVATSWCLSSRHRAPWRWIPPPGLVAEGGTAVRLSLKNPLSPLVDAGYVEQAIHRHFEPFFDRDFDEVLARRYGGRVRFVLNGRPIDSRTPDGFRVPLAIRVSRQRKPSASGYLARDSAPLPEDRRGVAVSTMGKVIKRGWDWLGLTPASADHIGGLIEVPAMAACLTLNKSDFIRAGPRGAIYLAYRKAIQEVVARHLAEWGDAKNGDEAARQRRARPVERDLQTVLADLADEFPLIAPLVDVRPGGQKKLAARGVDGAGGLLSNRIVVAEAVPVPASVPPAIEPVASEAPEPAAEPPPPRVVLASGGSKRPARFGLSIQFDNRDDASLARLVESVVWVNTANPAYKRAVASHAEGYHIALAVAMALCPLATEPENAHAFITAFLVRWGALVDPRAGRAPRGRPKSR